MPPGIAIWCISLFKALNMIARIFLCAFISDCRLCIKELPRDDQADYSVLAFIKSNKCQQ